MKKIFIVAILAICTTMSIAHCIDQQKADNAPLIEEDSVVAVELVAPNFTLTAIDGTKLSLNQLRGKYVVIDFWGSWCYWCMKGVPHMKEYYDKYKDKLEILGVNYGDDKSKWKQTVEENNMTWKHVYMEDDSVAKLYNVQGFPTKVIIDPEGHLLKTVVGESEEFYEFIDNLFGQK